MKRFEKLPINPEKMMKNEELISLCGGMVNKDHLVGHILIFNLLVIYRK
jgi:hypothetical protein